MGTAAAEAADAKPTACSVVEEVEFGCEVVAGGRTSPVEDDDDPGRLSAAIRSAVLAKSGFSSSVGLINSSGVSEARTKHCFPDQGSHQ